MSKRHAEQAKLKSILVYYDGPQLLYLQGDRGFKMLAVAINIDGKFSTPFFANEVTDEVFDRYMRGRVDLRFALTQGKNIRRSFLDYEDLDKDGNIKLRRPTKSQLSDPEIYPSAGFFSENHTHSLEEYTFSNEAKYAFGIAGKWGAKDFSKFTGKLDHIYSVASITESGLVDSTDKAKLARSLVTRIFDNGGAFKAMYDDFRSIVRGAAAPLSVSSIQYNSPGTITMRGDQEALREVVDILSKFQSQAENVGSQYKILRDILKSQGLLKSTGRQYSPNQGFSSMINRYSIALFEALGLENSPALYAACDKDDVLYAKLALSFYRQVKALNDFYDQGRISSKGFA